MTDALSCLVYSALLILLNAWKKTSKWVNYTLMIFSPDQTSRRSHSDLRHELPSFVSQQQLEYGSEWSSPSQLLANECFSLWISMGLFQAHCCPVCAMCVVVFLYLKFCLTHIQHIQTQAAHLKAKNTTNHKVVQWLNMYIYWQASLGWFWSSLPDKGAKTLNSLQTMQDCGMEDIICPHNKRLQVVTDLGVCREHK